MRVLFILLVLALANPALAAKKVSLPGGELDEIASGVIGKQWDCASPVDLRDRKERGVQVCLHTLAMDPATGESALVAELVEDGEDLAPLQDLVLELTLGLDGGDRVFRAFRVAEMPDGEGKLAPGELDDDHTRRRLRAVFSYRTWDPSVAIEDVHLKVKGSGKARWRLDDPAAFGGAWGARAALPVELGPGTCTVGPVTGPKIDALEDLLEDHGPGRAFVAEYLLPASDDLRVKLRARDPNFYVEFEDGKLIVRGSETFKWKLRDAWNEKGADNAVRVTFDGDDVLVEVNGAAFGPMYVAQRDWTRSPMHWQIELEKSGGRIEGLNIGPCDGSAVPKSLRPKDAPEAVAAAPKREKVAETEPDRGEAARPKERKEKPSALEVLQGIGKAAMIAQGAVGAVSQGVDAAQSMEGNVNAMNEGRYEDMESVDYQVSVGADGHVDSSLSKSKVTRTDGGVRVDGTASRASTRTGRVESASVSQEVNVGSVSASQSVGDASAVSGQIVVVNDAEGPVTVFVDGEEVGRSSKQGVVQYAAEGGSHRVELKDARGLTVWSGTVEVKLAGSVAIERSASGKVEVTSVGF